MVPLPAGKKILSEVTACNDENDRFASNRHAGVIPSATSQIKAASKVIAEVNTNRSFKVRGSNASEAVETQDRATTARSTRSASATHSRPAVGSRVSKQPEKVAPKKFTIYSDHENMVAEAGTAPAHKWAWQHQENSKTNPKKELNPPLLPCEKEKQGSSSWATENAGSLDRKPSWRTAAPKHVDENGHSGAVVAPEPVDSDINEEVGLDKLDWEMEKMNLGNKSEKRDSLPSGHAEASSQRRESLEEGSARTRSSSHTTPVASGTRVQRPLRTLEAIHDTLSRGAGSDGVSEAKGSSDIWVVRYMDYTSKYGLGFLLNNGCAGVYFNDSTKIILSADGLVFQYFERRHRSTASCTSEGDHMKATYTLTSHPPELVKKVTLLRHFRDYLIDRRTSDSPVVPEGKGNLVPVNPVELPSCIPGCVPWTVQSRGSDLDSWQDMPYLKKWVRTKHAVLLRLSNRSVQVSFFDSR